MVWQPSFSRHQISRPVLQLRDFMSSKFVLPGAALAVSEEGVAAAGTAEADGVIYSTIAGEPVTDPQTYSITVRARKALSPLKQGDDVFALVHDIYDTVSLVEFLPIAGSNERKSSYNRFAYLRISDVSRDYIENFRDVLRIGDVIRARVKEIKPLGIYLTVNSPELGVVKARCTVCRKPMQISGQLLSCPNCKSREQRKCAVKAISH